MPSPRFIVPAVHLPSHYHCISRVVDRNFVFGTHERDVFRKILRQVEGFCGVRVLTWTILSNHFHVLVEVPPKPAAALSDDEILDRCRSLYPKRAMLGMNPSREGANAAGAVGAGGVHVAVHWKVQNKTSRLQKLEMARSRQKKPRNKKKAVAASAAEEVDANLPLRQTSHNSSKAPKRELPELRLRGTRWSLPKKIINGRQK